MASAFPAGNTLERFFCLVGVMREQERLRRGAGG